MSGDAIDEQVHVGREWCRGIAIGLRDGSAAGLRIALTIATPAFFVGAVLIFLGWLSETVGLSAHVGAAGWLAGSGGGGLVGGVVIHALKSARARRTDEPSDHEEEPPPEDEDKDKDKEGVPPD